MISEITKFIKDSVKWLKKEQQGCCTYKLDDHLAICVGWSDGYGSEVRNDVIQAKDDLDWGINAGVKVWTSDYMRTDYDWINFPYDEDGEVWDLGLSIPSKPNYKRITRSLLKWYDEIKDLEMRDDGMVIGGGTK